ncbi:MAG: dTMP kinase [Planctomycetota bacterium]|nr:dTMP kinase [Planctomycetota bacterium]MDA1178629.1 dTMP kinase [Planctomycetota bacterium]
MNTARFFVLEGVDGVGKSTQLENLANWLIQLGHQVVTCRDPGSTPTGEAIRTLLLHATSPIDRNTEMLLYMAARAQLVTEVIRPAILAGQTIVCDRFLLSNVVYQGFAGGLDMDAIWQVGKVATGGLVPDLSIVLDLPEDVARYRRSPQPDRIESQGADYLDRVKRGFVELGGRPLPFPVAIVDASASTDEVHARVQRVVAPFLSSPTGPPRETDL